MGRLRGFLWLTAGLVVAVLAGLVAFTTLSRASAARSGQPAAQPTVSVVVATQAIAVRAVLTEADVELKEVPVELRAGRRRQRGGGCCRQGDAGRALPGRGAASPAPDRSQRDQRRWPRCGAVERGRGAHGLSCRRPDEPVQGPQAGRSGRPALLARLSGQPGPGGGRWPARPPAGWQTRRNRPPSTCCRTSPSPRSSPMRPPRAATTTHHRRSC